MPSLKSAYTITEPHPTVPQNTYTHSGRGGLGNFFRAPVTTPSSGIPTPAAPSTSSSTTTRRFYSGRGGAGNAHAAVERPVLSFDEEFQRAEVREKTATISHVGRGGAGNIFSAFSPSSSSKSRSGSGDDGASLGRHESGSSDSSTRSVADRLWGRITSVGHH
jgi:hypothetical protein